MNYVFPTMMGGLGNRLFQFSTAYSYSKKTGKDIIISVQHYQDNPHSKMDYLETIFQKIKKKNKVSVHNVISEPSHKCISYFDLPKQEGNIHIFGYFQCEKYFREYRSELKDLFMLPKLDESKTPKNQSLFMHVRRGDYTNLKIHGGYNYHFYYKNALDLLSQKFKDFEEINIYVFSNDLNWCKEWDLLKEYPNFTFHFLDLNELETLKFMSLCDKGGICANSSFSWWGAYLNDFVGKTVIFPNQWFFEKPHSNFENDIAFDGSICLTCI
jgi:hypothetical protein